MSPRLPLLSSPPRRNEILRQTLTTCPNTYRQVLSRPLARSEDCHWVLITCDIGFESRLALEDMRLLMCYAMVDRTQVRTLVLFRE